MHVTRLAFSSKLDCRFCLEYPSRVSRISFQPRPASAGWSLSPVLVSRQHTALPERA